jgi:hypothetical protein
MWTILGARVNMMAKQAMFTGTNMKKNRERVKVRGSTNECLIVYKKNSY